MKAYEARRRDAIARNMETARAYGVALHSVADYAATHRKAATA